MINRWTAKMKGAEGYITREISRRGGIAVRKTPESSSCVVSEEEKKNSSSDETRGRTLTPPNYAVNDPAPQWSCPTVDEVLAKAQFLSPLLYQIHCIGSVGFGFGFAHIYSEGPVKSGPYSSQMRITTSKNFIIILVLLLTVAESRIFFRRGGQAKYNNYKIIK